MEQQENKISYVKVWERFNTVLTPGHRAELRRVRNPDDLRDIPALYRLLAGMRPTRRMLQLIFCLPYAGHREKAEAIGVQLAKAQINEKRLFQMVRSDPPNDLIYLRRILQQVKPVVDWNDFGSLIFFWEKKDKRRLLEDFFLAQYSDKDNKEKGKAS
ncbi:MAG: type I-E CRISPR-associated protein Cse2/CasB [Desulfococcaceae bacterium]|jgi:CRISPR system Cascade subunit CasB|nr:type I-E CRISPR-associated protein Cse2/CasB [Desulfococcaceae bacterium]